MEERCSWSPPALQLLLPVQQIPAGGLCVCERVTGSHFPPISSKSATAFWRKLKVNRKAWRAGEGILHNADVHVTPLTVTGCGGLSCVLL